MKIDIHEYLKHKLRKLRKNEFVSNTRHKYSPEDSRTKLGKSYKPLAPGNPGRPCWPGKPSRPRSPGSPLPPLAPGKPSFPGKPRSPADPVKIQYK